MAGDSPVFISLDSASDGGCSLKPGCEYWWKTTGRDLANMMHVAQYPEETQHSFLSYYRKNLCPLLGASPSPGDEAQAKSWTWDGSTHEYSFEFKGSTSAVEVRFVADFSLLRPMNPTAPLDYSGTEAAIASFSSRTSGFDETWYRALKGYLDCSHLPITKQKALISKAGHMTPYLIGFDISRGPPPSMGMLPVMGKAYFLPCIAAAAQNKTRFEVICAAIRQLPGIASRPKLLSSLRPLEEYLSSKPKDWGNGARYLATDFVSPETARLKIYLRCPGTSFDDIWDYFSLGGRIPGIDDKKEMYREFVNLLGGEATAQFDRESESQAQPTPQVETANRRKLTTMYFSLDDKHPFPAPKVAFCVRNFAANDAFIAQGLDRWLQKYGWDDGNTTVESLVRDVL